MSKTLVTAFYRFVTLADYRDLRQPLLAVMVENDIKGTILLAEEGINGTVAGSELAIESLLAWFNKDARLSGLAPKYAWHDEPPFYRSKVKLKKEIVTMGVPGTDPTQLVGTYVKPADWNALISDPDVLVIDTRNDYEVHIGSYENAVNPDITNFRELPAYLEANLSDDKSQKIAMFCTGGIRCEKSTALLKKQGYENVYHLEGGILKYLEEVPEEESSWWGDCFVFDRRVAVNHKLEKGEYEECHACRMPLTADEQGSPHYQVGVSCPHCYADQDAQQRRRYQEREKQVELAEQRGEQHLGAEMETLAAERKQQKLLKRQQQAESD